MASNSTSSNGGGIGLGGAIFIVFLVLKLVGKIDWSWWWITSPLWIPAGLAISLFLIGIAVVAGSNRR